MESAARCLALATCECSFRFLGSPSLHSPSAPENDMVDRCMARPSDSFSWGPPCVPTFVGSDPYLSSTGFWSDEGGWISLRTYKLRGMY